MDEPGIDFLVEQVSVGQGALDWVRGAVYDLVQQQSKQQRIPLSSSLQTQGKDVPAALKLKIKSKIMSKLLYLSNGHAGQLR